MKLLIKEIDDNYVRENFERLTDFFKALKILQGQFQFFEITFAKGGDHFKYAHNLGFTPKDVIQTSVSGPQSVIWNFNQFDKTFLDITVSGPCTVRAFIGLYREKSEA